MAKAAKISPFRLASLLRIEKNPSAALDLFRNPPTSKPCPRNARLYDIIVCKLAKARLFSDMERVLDEMRLESRFVAKEVLFCRIITLYGRARMSGAAADIYRRIPSFRCTRTIRSFNTLLHELLECGDASGVRSLLCELDAGQLTPDTCTYNILIRACVSSKSLENAWYLFDEMCSRGLRPSIITFGTLIPLLCEKSKLDDAYKLREEMERTYNIKPNVYIFTSLIKGHCKVGELDLALKLKNEVLEEKDMILDSALYSTIIRALFRAGRKEGVVSILEEMKKIGLKPDTVTYNAMISGFCDAKEFDAAFEVLNEMTKKKCNPDIVSYNIIIAGLCKNGWWRDAKDLFEDLPRRGCRPDVVSYRILFEGLHDAGELQEAGMLLDEMVFNGYVPGSISVRKFVERLCIGGDHAVLMFSTFCNLAKLNAIEFDVWDTPLRHLIGDSEILKAGTTFDCLRHTSSQGLNEEVELMCE